MYFYPITPDKRELLAKKAAFKAQGDEQQKTESVAVVEPTVQNDTPPLAVTAS